jgi:tetratricopeptide (TPR) repeat protein
MAVASFAMVASGRLNVAYADTPPSAWDRAKDPSLRHTWSLHVLVRELMSVPNEDDLRNVQAASLQRARDLLERAGVEKSPDVRLRFDLGELYQTLDMHARAIEVLRAALDAEPDHSGGKDAWISLAYAYAKLGRQREERDAYVEFLSREADNHARATALLNLAEAEMHLGNLDEAVARYRETLRLAATIPFSSSAHETSVLAVWGLSVALDRAGDPAGSMEQAKLATMWDVGEQLIGHGPNVFFVPKYERSWYLGLAAMVHARDARDPRLSAMYWARAESQWNIYVTSALPADRWYRLARAHRDYARSEKLAAERKPVPSDLGPRRSLETPGVSN